MFSIDTSTALGQRLAVRLRDDTVIWLTTVSPAGRPAPNPVWFLWADGDVLIASQPGTAKLRHLAANPAATLHFNHDETGDDVQILSGTARLDPGGLSPQQRADYDAKYAGPIQRLGATPRAFHDGYSELIRFTPTRLRGF